MKNDVIVNVKLLVNVEHYTRLNNNMTESYVEKLARDKVSDIIINANKNISIESIAAIIKEEKDGN
ncbi:hypothetical protein LCGC14_1499360 [marine sediment metagenome]|uniref:Uncharacterized protein n=1 Tax=marine sediment metagenome TaxID=412755 RepID=A0A0F9LK58_9ZZZZ